MGDGYELNVGRFIADHPGWLVAAGFENYGWRARPRAGPGPWVSALTLDELAAMLDEAGAGT